MSGNARDKEFFRERGFGLQLGFGAHPALLVVDLINAFTDEEMPLGATLDAEVQATREVLAAARDVGVPIIYTTVSYDEEDMGDAGIWLRKMKGALTLRAGTPAVELDARLERRPEEAVVVKKYASSFFGTDLVSRLNARRIDTAIITGCTTSGCVRATAVDAVQYGFIPVVVRDAVGDRSQAAHQQSLFDLEQKYADVVTAAEAASYVRALATQDAPPRVTG
jgi:nicotinamidase-related amidase